MESVRTLFAQRSTVQKTTKNLHERDSRAKKHRTQCLLCSRSGDFLSHCSGALEPAEMTPEGKYRRQQILSWRDTDLLVPTSRSTTACLFSPFSKVSASNIRVSKLIRQPISQPLSSTYYASVYFTALCHTQRSRTNPKHSTADGEINYGLECTMCQCGIDTGYNHHNQTGPAICPKYGL